MAKIALIQLGYESNTMIEKRAVLQDLAPDGWIESETVAARFCGTHTGIGGVLDAAAQHGAQVVPMDLLSRNGAFNAGGIVDGAVWRQAVDHICGQLAACAAEYDGVCAAIHGAACADGLDDADGYFLRRVRQTVCGDYAGDAGGKQRDFRREDLSPRGFLRNGISGGRYAAQDAGR